MSSLFWQSLGLQVPFPPGDYRHQLHPQQAHLLTLQWLTLGPLLPFPPCASHSYPRASLNSSTFPPCSRSSTHDTCASASHWHCHPAPQLQRHRRFCHSGQPQHPLSHRLRRHLQLHQLYYRLTRHSQHQHHSVSSASPLHSHHQRRRSAGTSNSHSHHHHPVQSPLQHPVHPFPSPLHRFTQATRRQRACL